MNDAPSHGCVCAGVLLDAIRYVLSCFLPDDISFDMYVLYDSYSYITALCFHISHIFRQSDLNFTVISQIVM